MSYDTGTRCIKLHIKWFCSIKNSDEVLGKLKCRGFRATSLSINDFATLYTTLPRKTSPFDRMDFQKSIKNHDSLYLACNERKALFTSSDHFGHVRMYAKPYTIFWIIFILDSEPSYTDKLLEFLWVQIAPLS